MSKNGDDRCVLTHPDGRSVPLPKELFDAVWDFTNGHRKSGEIKMQFKNGGVAGVRGCHVTVTSEIEYK